MHLLPFLEKKGYKKYVIDRKNKVFKLATTYQLSTMENLYYVFISKDDEKILSKHNFVFDGKHLKNTIWFGLHEYQKPPTLIYPRPKISIKKSDGSILNEKYDDAMNIVLQQIEAPVIFEAMFSQNITLNVNLNK